MLVSSQLSYGEEIGKEKFLSTFQWEKKWGSFSKSTVKKYSEFLERKGLLDSIPERNMHAAKSEINSLLSNSLSWSNVGNEVTSLLIDSCPEEVLVPMVEMAEGVRMPEEKRDDIYKQYQSCSMNGFKSSMKISKKVFKDMAPDIKKIVDSHKKS